MSDASACAISAFGGGVSERCFTKLVRVGDSGSRSVSCTRHPNGPRSSSRRQFSLITYPICGVCLEYYRHMDIFSRQKRSEMMSRVRTSGTGPERYVVAALRQAHFRPSRKSSTLPFKPDVVLPKYRTAIFVHGCFWHGHNCRRAKLPSTNTAFWREKISRNVRRDARAARTLRHLGWHCLHIWSCRIESQTDRVLRRLAKSRAL